MKKQKKKSKPKVAPPASLIDDRTGKLSTATGIAVVTIAIVLGIVLRFWASFDDFWLDEIWSWKLAGDAKSPLDVVAGLHHDNNHYLNTFVIYLFGRGAPVYLYRLPAVLAGIGTVLLCGYVARQWSRPAGVIAVLLMGCSFLLIQYSSEARGYAYVMFFTMASFATIQESLERPRPLWEALFAVCAIFGFLSHLTYLFAYVALIAWSVWHRKRRDELRSRRNIVPLVCEIVIPCSFLLLLYIVDLRHVVVGGGDYNPVWSVIAEATSVAFGGPFEGPMTVRVAVLVALVGVLACWLLYRSGSDLWVPMVVGIFLGPALVILIAQPQTPYPRYFLVSMLFLQMLISWFLGWLYQRTYGKIVCVLAVIVILAGNAALMIPLLTYGRGGYEAAVGYMLDQTVGDKILVASDHDFRNKTVLDFYFARAGEREFARYGYYMNAEDWPPQGPEWLLLHEFAQRYSPESSVNDNHGHTYDLARVFRYAGLSGFHWALYHNTNRPTNAPLQGDPQGPAVR